MSATDLQLDGPELGEPDGPRRGRRGTLIVLGVVLVLVAATGLTMLGLGAADRSIDTFDSSSWLWSSTRGEVDHVNGATGRVDTRARIVDAQGHEVEVIQNDRYLILHDLETGQITALDLTTLQVSAVLPTTPGVGVSVALYGDVAIIVDGLQGVVRQLDPRTLAPIGDPLTLRRGIISGGFDGAGLLWVAIPTEGTVVAVRPGTAGAGPSVVRTLPVVDPGHDLVLSSLDEGVAVLDNTTQTLAVASEAVQSVPLGVASPGVVPQHTVGRPIAVTIPTERLVLLVDGATVTRVTIRGTGPLGVGVFFAGRVYVPDLAAGVVLGLTTDGTVVATIPVPSPTGRVDLEVREGYLFINSPDGPQATVVDSQHKASQVDKYQEGVLGGDPPLPAPPAPGTTPPAPGRTPPAEPTPPGAPQAVSATGSDRAVDITWRAASDHGSAITRYVIEGAGAPITVGASQRQVHITGLTNGTTYRFSIYAVNAKGNGPKVFTNNVVPTRDVPDRPTSVNATANPNGSVRITWSVPNGQGHPIVGYRVTATSGTGVTSVVATPGGNSVTLAAGTLTYGTQYSFTVAAVNDLNAASGESSPSNTIIPYAPPDAPLSLAAATSPTTRGTVEVSWRSPAGNGRPIDRYEIVYNGNTTSTTATSIALTVTVNAVPADNTLVRVEVRAVNSAGAGPSASASARTMRAPSVTVTDTNPNYGSISVIVTPNGGGGNAQCTFDIPNTGSDTKPCSTNPVTLTVGGLTHATSYSGTVTISNAVGSAQVPVSASTSTLHGMAVCTPPLCAIYSALSIAGAGTPVSTGYQFVPSCKQNGTTVAGAGGQPNSRVWLRIGGGAQWFPLAWTELDGGGGSISSVRTC